MLPDILPDVVLGWLLLHKSGLDPGERATVLATTRNQLDFDVVEAALRSVWTEADLRNRDQSRGRETRTNMANAVYFGADALTWQSESEDEESENESESEDDDPSAMSIIPVDATATASEPCEDAAPGRNERNARDREKMSIMCSVE